MAGEEGGVAEVDHPEEGDEWMWPEGHVLYIETLEESVGASIQCMKTGAVIETLRKLAWIMDNVSNVEFAPIMNGILASTLHHSSIHFVWTFILMYGDKINLFYVPQSILTLLYKLFCNPLPVGYGTDCSLGQLWLPPALGEI